MEKQFFPEVQKESDFSKTQKALKELKSLEEKVAFVRHEINTFLWGHTLKTAEHDLDAQEGDREDLQGIFHELKNEIRSMSYYSSPEIMKKELEELFERYFGENNYPKIAVITGKTESHGYSTTITLNDNCYISIHHDENEDNVHDELAFDGILLELANKAGIQKL